MIAGLLGLIGLAMLLIGFVTAHSLAQRFGRPIEALARAANPIGRGDFLAIVGPIAKFIELYRSPPAPVRARA